MIRRITYALLASTAAIVAVPQVAQAGCNGTGCGSLSSTANYSSSEKKVKATITNKDATSPIHVKFCVNVDYHCNGFDLTLAPHETVAKDVPFAGPKPPQIAVVDVVTADFPASRSSSGGSAPASGAPANSGAAVPIDTPKGKIMVLAAKQAAVTPNLNKAIDYYDKMSSAYLTAQENASTMHQLVEALGPLDNVEAEARQLANKPGNRELKNEAHIARGAELQLKHFAQTLKLAETEARSAAAQLTISEDDLKEAENLENAKKLRDAVAKDRAALDGFLKFVSQAADIASLAVGDPISKASAAVSTVGRLMDMVDEVNPLVKEAGRLEEEAAKIHMTSVRAKVASAKDHLTSLRQQLGELKSLFPEFQDLLKNSNATYEANYDQAAKKTSGRFNYDSLRKAVTAAQNSVEATRRSYEMAYGVRENIRQINAHAGDDSAWMAFPGEGRKVLGSMYDESKPVFDWAVKERPIAEALLKRLTEMYQLANNSAQ